MSDEGQLINGHRFGYSSIELNLDGFITTGVKSISYKHKTTVGKTRGNSFNKTGRTEGEGEADGMLEMYLRDHQNWIARLAPPNSGKGFTRVAFTVTVHFEESPGDGVITHVLYGTRMLTYDLTAQEGPDPITVKSELDIMQLDLGGVQP